MPPLSFRSRAAVICGQNAIPQKRRVRDIFEISDSYKRLCFNIWLKTGGNKPVFSPAEGVGNIRSTVCCNIAKKIFKKVTRLQKKSVY